MIISIYIGPTRVLEVDFLNTKYNSERKLHKRCINNNWDDDSEIEKAITIDNDNDNDAEDLQEKTRRLKKEKQERKKVVAKARACQQLDEDDNKAATSSSNPHSFFGLFIVSSTSFGCSASSGPPISSSPLTFFDSFAAGTYSPNFLTLLGLFIASAAFTTSLFAIFYLFNTFCPIPFSPCTYFTTSITLFPMQIKCTSLPLKDDNAFYYPISLLGIYRKQL